MRAWLALGLAAIVAAGCLDDGASLFVPGQETRAAAETDTYPGLSLQGTLQVGHSAVVEATAANNGTRTYKVETGCSTPWDSTLWDATGSQMDIQAPQVQCMSFALRDFAPGKTETHTFTWNGTLWNHDSHRYDRAPAGTYTWSIRFVAYQPDGVALKRFDLDFPITVR
jgi:hypothetical protein